MDINRYQVAISKLRDILAEYTDGWANDKARNGALCCAEDILSNSDGDIYVSEKVSEIKHAIERLYSARKHLRHRSGSSSGVHVLRADIGSLIGRLESWPNISANMER